MHNIDWATSEQPACLVYRNATQTITSATFTKVAYNAATYDNNNDFDLSTNEFVAPVDGVYSIAWKVESPSATNAITQVYVNGSTQGYRGLWTQNGRGSIGSMPLKLSAGDRVSIYAYFQGDTGIRANPEYTWFAAALMGG